MSNQTQPADEHSAAAEFGEALWVEKSIEQTGGAGFGHFLESFRRLQNAVVQANVPAEAIDRVTKQLDELALELEGFQVAERDRWAGHRRDLPGRGSALAAPFVVLERTPEFLVGTVRFQPYHIGGNSAVHGGILGMLFDSTLGELAAVNRRATNPGSGMSRTAYLKINYRAITPIDVDLRFELRVDRVVGRKTFVSGALTLDGNVLADAEALFLELLPGQQ